MIQWSDISSSEGFRSLSEDQREQVRQRYFDDFVAPNAPKGIDPAELRSKYDELTGAKTKPVKSTKAEKDAGLSTQGEFDTGMPAEAPPTIDARGSVMDGRPATVAQPAVAEDVNPAFEAALKLATPEQRAKIAAEQSPRGMTAKRIIDQWAALTPTQRRVHNLREDLVSEAIGQGATREAAEAWAKRVIVGGESQAGWSASNFDFDTAAEYKDKNPVQRGAAKARRGMAQSAIGVAQFAADVAGVDAPGLESTSAMLSREQQAIGEGKTDFNRNLEGAIQSIVTQAPSLAVGFLTGGTAVPLLAMGTTTFGQEYADGKQAGLTPEDASKRAAIFGAAEIIGEKVGMPSFLKSARAAMGGAPTQELVPLLVQHILREIPGEQLTTAIQFGTDKAASFGLTPNATTQDYVRAATDTLVQTVMQAGMMSGTALGASAVRQKTENDKATQRADEAQSGALEKWGELNFNGQPAAQPNGDVPRETAPAKVDPIPQILGAESVDDAIRAATEAIKEPVSEVQPPPAITAPPAPISTPGLQREEAPGSTESVGLSDAPAGQASQPSGTAPEVAPATFATQSQAWQAIKDGGLAGAEAQAQPTGGFQITQPATPVATETQAAPQVTPPVQAPQTESAPTKIADVGRTPQTAEPLTLRPVEGGQALYHGNFEVLDYESAEPVVFRNGETTAQIREYVQKNRAQLFGKAHKVYPPKASAPEMGTIAPETGTLQDFATKKGEVKVFQTEKQAGLYQKNKTNSVPGNYKPRQTAEGWVLSRPAVARSEKQKANDVSLEKEAELRQLPPEVAQAAVENEDADPVTVLDIAETVADDDNFGVATSEADFLRAMGATEEEINAEINNREGQANGGETATGEANPDTAGGVQGRPDGAQEQRQGERSSRPTRGRRKADLTREELIQDALTSGVVDLPNLTAFAEDEMDGKAPVYGYSDGDNFKAVNDILGHDEADKVLQGMAEIFRQAADQTGAKAYHRSGDEFVFRFDSQAQADAFDRASQEIAANTRIEVTDKDGNKYVYDNPGFSTGTGKSVAAAERASDAVKQQRLESGQRSPSGQAPRGLSQVRAEGQQDNVNPGGQENADVRVSDTSPEPVANETKPKQVEPAAKAKEKPTDITEKPAPAVAAEADIPPAYFLSTKMQGRVFNEGTRSIQMQEMSAKEALESVREDLDALEALQICVGAK